MSIENSSKTYGAGHHVISGDMTPEIILDIETKNNAKHNDVLREMFRNGVSYAIPMGIRELDYYQMMLDLVDYVNSKKLTIRQSQTLFNDCSEMLLDIPYHNKELFQDEIESETTDSKERTTNTTSNIMYEIMRNGKDYVTPEGFGKKEYYEMMFFLIKYAKMKSLTIRQSQKLFKDCSDGLLDMSFDEINDIEPIKENRKTSVTSNDYKNCGATTITTFKTRAIQ